MTVQNAVYVLWNCHNWNWIAVGIWYWSRNWSTIAFIGIELPLLDLNCLYWNWIAFIDIELPLLELNCKDGIDPALQVPMEIILLTVFLLFLRVFHGSCKHLTKHINQQHGASTFFVDTKMWLICVTCCTNRWVISLASPFSCTILISRLFNQEHFIEQLRNDGEHPLPKVITSEYNVNDRFVFYVHVFKFIFLNFSQFLTQPSLKEGWQILKWSGSYRCYIH